MIRRRLVVTGYNFNEEVGGKDHSYSCILSQVVVIHKVPRKACRYSVQSYGCIQIVRRTQMRDCVMVGIFQESG
jgi:hypothetical protein